MSHRSGRKKRGSRKELREARLLVLISALFVAGGVWMLTMGELAFGLATTLFFSACLIVGVVMWVGERTNRRGDGRSGRTAERLFALLMPAAALLMGLGCLALLILTLMDPDWPDTGTAARYSPALIIGASLVGTVLFGGGSVLLLIRARRGRRASAQDDKGPIGSL